MHTTNLFVELLVIGLGAACWVGLLVFSAAGSAWANHQLLQSYPAMAALLGLVYVLGIISDRAADRVFDLLFSGRIRRRFFAAKREYQDARRLVFASSSRLADMHEYGRTRIRICRGWALNAVLIAVSMHVYVWTRLEREPWSGRLLLWGTCGCLVLAAASWWAWHFLCSQEYLKIREHAEFLRGQPGGAAEAVRKAA